MHRAPRDVGADVFPLRIALFGQPRVVAANASREFVLPRKTLNVLAYLVLNRDRPILRDSVAFALFPDDGEETARANLRRNLSYLLSSLPTVEDSRRFVLADNERLAWNANAPTLVDVVEFERAIADGRDDDAIAAYSGELLPTLYDDWTIAGRERLRDTFHFALTRTVARERAVRHFDAATIAARRLLDEDPWREDVVRLLMTVRFEAGDRAGALGTFARFAERLRDEMHAEPMDETLALRAAILDGAPLPTSERIAIRANATPSAPELVLPFVGREGTFALALETWRDVAGGNARLIAVAGEAGVGKSRFVTELARHVEREGAFVARGETTAGGERAPYESVLEALRHPLGARSRSSAVVPDVWYSELRRLFEERAVIPGAVNDFERMRLFEALRRGVVDLARTRPLVLIFEDLHWAGAATIDLLDYFSTRLETARVLIAITMRTDELSRAHPLRALRGAIERREVGRFVTIARVPSSELARAARAAAPALDDANIARALARADGIPLLLAETLRDALAGHTSDASGISELVGARFERLSDAGETALVFAAVIGARFDVATLASAMAWPVDEVMEALGSPIELGLVRTAVGRAAGLALSFTHHLVHAAAYERVAATDRAQAHALVARVIDALPGAGGARAAEIAGHFAAAGDTPRAVRRYLDASRYAASVFANDETLALSSRAITLLDSSDAAEIEARFEFAALRERALERLGRKSERRSEAAKLVALADDLDDERRCEALERLIHAYLEEPIKRSEALAELHELAARSGRAAALVDQFAAWEALVERGDFPRARDAYGRAALRFDSLGDERAALRARFAQIRVLGNLGALDEVRAQLAHLRPIMQAHEDLALIGEFHRAAAVAVGARDLESALADARRALEIAQRIGDRAGEAGGFHDVGYFLGRLRRFEEALDQFGRALVAYRDAEERSGEALTLMSIATMRRLCGDYAPVRELLAQIDPTMRARPLIAWSVEVSLGDLASREGDAEEAERRLLHARELVEVLGEGAEFARGEYALATHYARVKRYDDARRHLDRALATYPRVEQPAQYAEALARSALLFAIAGDLEIAREHAARSRELASHATVQHYGETAWSLAAAAAIIGDIEDARDLAGRALRACVEAALHMGADLAECYAQLPAHVRAAAFLNGREVALEPV